MQVRNMRLLSKSDRMMSSIANQAQFRSVKAYKIIQDPAFPSRP